nr:DUF896 family protein [Enterococcus timonensis]
MNDELITRINELSQKKKTVGLSADEKIEQEKLRQEYLQSFKKNMRHHIEGLKIVDDKGHDVTPDKLKKIQKEKGLHNR